MVLKDSSPSAFPWVLNKEDTMLPIERICRSQTPPCDMLKVDFSSMVSPNTCGALARVC